MSDAARRTGLFAAALLVAALALMPLRLGLAVAGLDRTGLSASRVEGSLWNGRLIGAGWRGVAIGDVSARLAPLPLLAGQLRLAVANVDIAGELLGGGLTGVAGLTGRLRLATAGPLGLAAIDFDDFGLTFDSRGCRAATGRLTVAPAALGTRFAGSPRCTGPAALLPLTSGNGDRLTLQLASDGGYVAVVDLADPGGSARAGLRALGLAPSPHGLSGTIRGRW